jgi:hypothetical protein
MNKFNELKSTIIALKHAEAEFNKIFSLRSKKEILESINFHPSGDIDIEELKKHAGTQFDPDVVNAFFKAYKEMEIAV